MTARDELAQLSVAVDTMYGELDDLRQRIDAAMSVALDAVYDGAHHKQWVVDQMARALMGDAYDAWKPDGWDVGIAP